jgi:hypothetical protein
MLAFAQTKDEGDEKGQADTLVGVTVEIHRVLFTLPDNPPQRPMDVPKVVFFA